VAVRVASGLIAKRPGPTWTSCSGGVRPPPTVGTEATVAGTHFVTPRFTGTIIGADEGPKAWKDGTTDTTARFRVQIVAGTCAGINIGAFCDPTA
jgi:hypothetical protein